MALRIICDRENEIDAFIPEEYWTMDAVLDVEEKKPVTAKFYGDNSMERLISRIKNRWKISRKSLKAVSIALTA